MPTNPIFSQLFGRSPVAPMQKHMNVAARTASELMAFMFAVFDDDWDSAMGYAEAVNSLEQEADALKREIRQSLPRGLFMPVSRSDLLEMLHVQDKIPNLSKDIVGLTVGRHMSYPAAMHPVLREYVEKSVQTTTLALQALNELDELFETGFSGHEIEVVTGIVDRLDDAEHDVDVKQVEVRQQLIKIEKELNPIDVMFMYRVIDWIGDISDQAQTVGNRLLYLTAK